ncbi:hypothetical protein C8Q79DRAFT_1010334 [Trametes meyenii]|nr:hypothetical protein C8Q79DRAFT_1010334 [Trametes meyenii]
MQRRTSQTFQRLRKLSNSLMQAVVPSLSNKPSREGSFFEYDKSGWHPPSHPEAHRRPSYKNGQHVSKEDIRYPLLAPKQPNPFDINAEPSRKPALPSQASTKDRTPVARDPQRRSEVQRAYPRANTEAAKRPERPREEDLPYGAVGAIPKVLAPPYVPPPPAVGHGPPARGQYKGRERADNISRFPEDERAARQRRVVERAYREKPLPVPPRETRTERREAPRNHVEPVAPFFNSFGTVPASKPQAHAPSTSRAPARYEGSYPSQMERRPDRERPEADPRLRERQPGVRRISSSGDVHLPPQHPRYRQDRGDQNAPPRPPDLRPVKSAPLRAPEPVRSVPPVPRSHLMHVTKPHPRNVPRDVSPENPQRLPTPRRSHEEVRSDMYTQPWPPPTPAAARTGLRVQQSAGPQHVKMAIAPEHLDAMARKAQVVRPAREHREREREGMPQPRPPSREKERERGRGRGRRRPTHTAAVEVEYYGMADAFTQEITIALTEPERANPLPLDWRAYVATGPDYGVRPLVTKKSRQAALGAKY